MGRLFKTHFALVSLISLFLLGATNLNGQTTDCTIPSNWLDTEVYPFMKNVYGKCPSCMSKEVYRMNAERYFCLNLKLSQLESQKATSYSTNPVLQEEIEKLKAQNDSLQGVLEKPPAGIIVIDMSTTINNSSSQDSTKNEKKKEVSLKVPKWDLTGHLGILREFHSATLNPPCNCPHIPVGFNEKDGAFAGGLSITRRPDLDTTFSISGDASLIWGNIKLPNGNEASALPALTDININPTFARKFDDTWTAFAQPSLWVTHAQDIRTTWGGFNVNLGGQYILSDDLRGQLTLSLPIAANAWLPGDDSEKARKWGFSGKVYYGAIHGIIRFSSLYASREGELGGSSARLFTLGAGISF